MEGAVTLLDSVTSGIGTVISWVGTVISSLFGGQLAELAPLFAIGISISAIMLGLKIIRGVVWGA